MPNGKPNILVLWGDDIGYWNISANNKGMMGYTTPNIDRLANEGVAFTDFYGQQSCTAGRAAFITGQNPLRTAMTKVGLPGADFGIRPEDPTIAELLKPLGYATAQFGMNHLGISTSICPPIMASMSSSAICTTSMPRRNPSSRTTPRTRRSGSGLGRAA